MRISSEQKTEDRELILLREPKDSGYYEFSVKGDNKIDDPVVMAKKEAAEEMAVASGVEYKMYPESRVIRSHILDDE